MSEYQNTALVLEGGGMRGVFTAGVLDYFLAKEIRFPFIVGVSAGSSNGLSFLSRQKGRAHQCNIELLDKYQYIGLKQLLTKHCIMDFDLLFKEFPDEIIPYDYETYFQSPERFQMVTCNCLTGKPMYLEEKKDKERLLLIARASCSLPFVCPIIEIDNIPMLDGGICDAIPIRHALSEGYKRAVVVLTRNIGYRKKEKKVHIPSFLYKKYPNLREQLKVRAFQYNQTMDFIEKEEKEGRLCVIRPVNPIKVDRIERDTQKLSDLYDEGYQCASKILSFKDTLS